MRDLLGDLLESQLRKQEMKMKPIRKMWQGEGIILSPSEVVKVLLAVRNHFVGGSDGIRILIC